MKDRSKRRITWFLAFLWLTAIISLGTVSAIAIEPPPPPGGTPSGFETIVDLGTDVGTLYPGDSAVVQKIEVTDDDSDVEGVTVTEVKIGNTETAGATDIAKIEVLEGDTVRGTASTVNSLPVTIGVSNFTVADDSSATVKVKVYVASSASAGTLKLETTLVQTEGISTGIQATATDGVAEDVATGAEVRAGNPSKGNRIGGRVQGRDRLSQNAKFYRPGPKRESCVFIHTYTHSAPGGGLVD